MHDIEEAAKDILAVFAHPSDEVAAGLEIVPRGTN